jgi:hypothetical protein
MLVSGILLAVCAIVPMSRFNPASSRKILILAIAAACILDGFFLIPYAMKITTLNSTSILYDSEPALNLSKILVGIGLVNAPLALIGIILWASSRAPKIHPVVIWAISILASLFLATEYGIPLVTKALNHSAAIAFAPSRFLTDLNYFLPLLAGISIAFLQARLRIKTPWVFALICCAALADYRQWKGLIRPDESSSPPPGFVEACRWINTHTSPTTVVLDRDNWTTYLTWRRSTFTPLSGSDPIPDHSILIHHLAAIVSGETPPDSPDMTIVKILPTDTPSTQPILWTHTGYKVIQIWPAQR